MAVTGWMPRPWNAELCGCLWLPRLLDKGRRTLEGQRQGVDLMNGYLFYNWVLMPPAYLAFRLATRLDRRRRAAAGQ